MIIDRALKQYQSSLKREGCARWAFCRALEILSGGERLNWRLSPQSLVSQARDLSQVIRRSDRLNAQLRSGVSQLCALLQRDLTIYIIDVDGREDHCTMGEYLSINAGDLEVELAVTRLWAGKCWAPAGARFMVSLTPWTDEDEGEDDGELQEHEDEERRAHLFDLMREFSRS